MINQNNTTYICTCMYRGGTDTLTNISIPTEQQRRAVYGTKMDTVREGNLCEVRGQSGCAFNAALLLRNVQRKPGTAGRLEKGNSIQYAAHARDGKKACELCLCHA